MKRHRALLVLASATAVLWVAPLTTVAASATGSVAHAAGWHRAMEVPGLGALNRGGGAELVSLSCASSGNCAGGGFYLDGSHRTQAFVVSEENGIWRKASEVRRSGALNVGGDAFVSSVSCASAGNCAADGAYADGSGDTQAFVVSEKDGAWGKAIEVPGFSALNAGGNAGFDQSVSCGSAGNCAAAGRYTDGSGHAQAFVATEKNGTWGKAMEVPGSAALNAGGDAFVSSVSCASAGNCAAGGQYADGSGHGQAFVANEKDGAWGKAMEVPGSGALNVAGGAAITSVSCASAGNCAAGGFYASAAARLNGCGAQGFVVSEKDGTWGTALGVPGLGRLNSGECARVFSVSCASAGDCAAGGGYSTSLEQGDDQPAFVASEVHGAWRKARKVAITGLSAVISSVSCAAADFCVAVVSSDSGQFLIGAANGSWGKALRLPGLQRLNRGRAAVRSVSCAPAGTCAAGGYYTGRSGHGQAFVVSQSRER